ncbi:MAG TPA: FAD-dependent oxidoreductase [Jiangellaceae bacterium]|nr:FAD-dependent oxidoreductase [Jiangellaceae bacterium]
MATSTEGWRHVSLWLDDTPPTNYPRLDGDRTVDVAVIGGGITGLTTALLLARDGMRVCLVDQNSIGSGTTGHTTAKVTSQHQLIYARLHATYGAEGTATYAAAMEAAKERVASFAAEGIDCDLRRRPAYVYARRPNERSILETETRAAQEAGLPATFDDKLPMPFPTAGGMRFDNQIEFHAQKYVLGLAERFVAAGGEIFENTRATQVHEAEPCLVHTEQGRIRANHVIVATLMPFLDRGGFFARAFPSRSYVITARVAGGLPDAMLISALSPVRSIRSVPFQGEELLMIGGEGHHLGSSKATQERYDTLAQFARNHWNVISFEHRWSAQDYRPSDGVPYIGRLNIMSKRIHIATGFKKWGMTSGTLAGMLVSDSIAGRPNDWAELFTSTRVKPIAGGPRFITENARVGFKMVADRILAPGRRSIEELERGEGGIVTSIGQKVAGFRDDEGRLHAVSTRCTHLGCQVAWNAAERSWDCPCHGSRFAPDGEILNGPATKPLPSRPTPTQGT